MAMTFDELRAEVLWGNQMLPKAGLVTMHSGNVSGRLPGDNRVVIKPSGVDYDTMRVGDLAVVDLDGKQIAGENRPSVDTSVHVFLYRNCPEMNSVIHTHSNYATAFAATGRSIACHLTAIADEFGDIIPCTPYVSNDDDLIGWAILEHRKKAPAILLGNHGVFTWGESVRAAVKAAVMVEDVAKTVAIAGTIGTLGVIPPAEAAKWWERYHTRYGQK